VLTQPIKVVILVLTEDSYTSVLLVNVYNLVHVKPTKITMKTNVLLVMLTVCVVKLLPPTVLNVTMNTSYTKTPVLILVQTDIMVPTKSVMNVTILV
jgi:hypothetical protein